MSTFTSATSQQLDESPVAKALREHSFNRAVAYVEHQDAVTEHHVVRAEMLAEIEATLGEASAADMLSELRSSGLLWSVVARYVGVSDAALRKWRRGGSIDVEHRRRLARLTALARLFSSYAINTSSAGFAEWLDLRIIPNFSATPLDLLRLHRHGPASSLQPLLDWMLEQPDGEHAEDLLDRYLSDDWRDDRDEEQRYRIVRDKNGDRLLMFDE